MNAGLGALAVVLGLSGAVDVRTIASDPVGVFCLVQKVVMAPDESTPSSAQVWGTCALAIGGIVTEAGFEPGTYATPFKGYLYYSAPSGREAVARREWADLKRLAGTTDIAAFGARGLYNGRMRWPDEKPEKPDPYPIHMGVTKITAAERALGTANRALFEAMVNVQAGR